LLSLKLPKVSNPVRATRASRAKGRDLGAKFDVKYDSEDKLKTFQVTELPAHPPVYPFFPKEHLQFVLAVFGLWTAAGDFNLPDTDILNKRFPEIQPLSFSELLHKAWHS
jgi:hypothetical protein